jgi:hypothetical protein
MKLKITYLAIIMLVMIVWPRFVSSQSTNYWTRSFNEESSLLSGAVVGGGSGPTAIYYNPASISEVKASKLSLNASLFSFDMITLKNGLGTGIDINSTKFNIEPRFLSYMIKSKRFDKWSFEIAILNNENGKFLLTESVDDKMDILKGIPGDERYFAFYKFSKQFRDDWGGFGASVRISERLTAGVSMFITVKSLEFEHSLEINAYPLEDSIPENNLAEPLYVASYGSSNYLKFNDYRLTWKIGFLYQKDNYSFGMNITTPSLGGIYSDGKRDYRKEQQTNITSPESGEPLPDYVIADYQEKENVSVNYKTPFSLAAGFTYYRPDKEQIFYISAEYFSRIEPYRWVEAEESAHIGSTGFISSSLLSEWLTYINGAKALFNAAFGISWKLKQDLQLLGGFRTDFSNKINLDYRNFEDFQKLPTIQTNLYHVTCGLSWNILGQDLITGLQYTLGYNKNLKQLANLSDPVEFNTAEMAALQGTRTYEMDQVFHSISLYLGASFNFGEDK